MRASRKRGLLLYTAPQWAAHTIAIVARIHLLNFTAAVLSFNSEARRPAITSLILALASPSSRLSLRSTRSAGWRP